MIKNDDSHGNPSTEDLVHADRHQFAIEAAGVGFWEVMPVSNTLLWDKRCKALFGIAEEHDPSFEEAVQLIHPDDREKVITAVQLAMKGEMDGKYDMRYRTIGATDQKIRWVHFSGRAYFNDRHELIRFGGIAQDITESQFENLKTVVALQQSEERFRSIFEQAPMAKALLTGPELTLEVGNEAIFRIWGKNKSAIGQRIIDVLPEIKGQGFLELLESVYHNGTPYYGYETLARLEHNGQLKDAWFNFVYTPIRYDGVVTGVIVLASDVTEQVKAREKITQSEEILRNMVQHSPIGICVIEASTLIPGIVNESFAVIAGKSTNVLLGQSYWDSFAEVRELYEPVLQKVIDEGEPYFSDDVALMLQRNGTTEKAHVNFVYAPIKNINGGVEKVAIWVLENTQQVLARHKTEEAEASLRGAVELAQLGTWSIDISSNDLTYSARMQDWYGFTPDKAGLEDIFSRIDEKDRARVEESITRTLDPASNILFDEEFTISSKETGRKRILHAQGKVIREDNNTPTKVVGTAQDVTAQRQLQLALEEEIRERTEELDASNEELQAANEELAVSNEELAQLNEELAQLNEELTSSNQDLLQFAHVTSHDLKEPLRKMKTFLSRMEDDPENSFTPRSKSFLERVNASAARMSDMIEGVLKYSTINAGGQVIGSVDLNDSIKNILVDLEMLITQKNASITVHPLPTVQGVSILFYQLFYNLIINALKFSTAGTIPTIVITASEAIVNNTTFALIDVQDNGIGFEQAYADTIFQTFTRLNSKDEYEGTGLGLSLCKKIVQRHHGIIEARSQPGQGALFSILLPLYQPLQTI